MGLDGRDMSRWGIKVLKVLASTYYLPGCMPSRKLSRKDSLRKWVPGSKHKRKRLNRTYKTIGRKKLSTWEINS